jgi:hypothetical protein
MFSAARWRPLPKRRNASMAISACCRVALTMSKPPSRSRSSRSAAAGLAPAALGFAYALAVATDHSPGAAGGAGGDMTIRKKLIEVSISLEAIESRWRATQER